MSGELQQATYHTRIQRQSRRILPHRPGVQIMSLKSIAVTVLTVLVIVAVANRIAFTRNLINPPQPSA